MLHAPTDTSTTDAGDLHRFDILNERGFAIPHPSVADTLFGDTGGVRSTLADNGFGFYAVFAPNVFEYDLTQANAGKPLAVNGQVGTWNIAGEAATITFDLGKIGLEDGQLQFSGAFGVNSLQKVNGPDVARIRALAYNQILADGNIEIQAGYYPIDLHFFGLHVGGSFAAGTLGPRAVIPYEVGISYGGFGTPAAEIKFNFPNGVYDRAAVVRSLAPGGTNVEVKVNPDPGLTFAPTGTGAMFINETGYKTAASDSQRYTWIRVGGIYNLAQFRNFSNGQGTDNWALYALADRQLAVADWNHPSRGFYAGASVMYAPPEQNLFSQYYEVGCMNMGHLTADQMILHPSSFLTKLIAAREGRQLRPGRSARPARRRASLEVIPFTSGRDFTFSQALA